ncbi:MAG: hypothetical protein Q9166_001799 [cf. Caloplaca sp. 2 TL-2023]
MQQYAAFFVALWYALTISSSLQNSIKNVERLMNRVGSGVFGAPKANKRLQMIQGINHVKTPIAVFADDDVFWPKTFLTHLLAPFEDSAVGAVGPFITLERPRKLNVWDFLGAAYLERWNFCVAATSNINGGVTCLSGRTSAVRSQILQDEAFKDHFANEKWFFDVPLSKGDDDNCLTRWLVNHGWKIKIQNAPEASATTALESGPKFISQCIRWDRTTWRSNITSMFFDRSIWTAQPWCSYALHLSSINPSAAVLEGVLTYLLFHAYDDGQPIPYFPSSRQTAFVLLIGWISFARTIKLWPYFYRHPSDLKFLPAVFAFAYLHGIIRLYSFATVFRTSWDGSRMSLANLTNAAANFASGARDSSSTSLSKMANTIAAGAKENSSKLRKSEGTLKRALDSRTDLRRLTLRSDSSG